MSEIFLNTREISYPKWWCNVLIILLYEHQRNTKPFHSKCFYAAKGAAKYYVVIATVFFTDAYVKIRTCYFHVWRYDVFAGKLTWYFIGVYIIISIYYIWSSLEGYFVSVFALKENELNKTSLRDKSISHLWDFMGIFLDPQEKVL